MSLEPAFQQKDLCLSGPWGRRVFLVKTLALGRGLTFLLIKPHVRACIRKQTRVRAPVWPRLFFFLAVPLYDFLQHSLINRESVPACSFFVSFVSVFLVQFWIIWNWLVDIKMQKKWRENLALINRFLNGTSEEASSAWWPEYGNSICIISPHAVHLWHTRHHEMRTSHCVAALAN